MRTAGIDFAAQAANTAAATIEWFAGGARLVELAVDVDDERCADVIASADKTGIDAPFGWPIPFVEFVSAVGDHTLIAPTDGTGVEWRRTLVYRQTDLVVREHLGRLPLSVSADLIAHPAFRLAGLLARLAADGLDVERSGRGRVVEAYPALSLRLWGLPNTGYKRDRQRLRDLADALTAAAPWLDIGDLFDTLAASDHAFDAVIAALTARASAQGWTIPPEPAQADAAHREGWTAIPTVTLAELHDPAPSVDTSEVGGDGHR